MANRKHHMDLLPFDALKGVNLGISVSDSPDLERLGLLEEHFKIALGELARIVILAKGALFYGGHLQPEGLTIFLIEELKRYGRRDFPLKVCLAWTVHRAMSKKEIKEQLEILELVGEIYFLGPDGQILDELPEEPPVRKFSQEEQARALTGLRKFMARETAARIVIGGKREGFKGAMSGIVEEVLYSLEYRKPLYLAGGFGGATHDVIRTLRPEFAEWLPKMPGYKADPRHSAGLNRVNELATNNKCDGYANGLDNSDNRILAASYRPSEIAALVAKGLGKLYQGNQNDSEA